MSNSLDAQALVQSQRTVVEPEKDSLKLLNWNAKQTTAFNDEIGQLTMKSEMLVLTSCYIVHENMGIHCWQADWLKVTRPAMSFKCKLTCFRRMMNDDLIKCYFSNKDNGTPTFFPSLNIESLMV